MNTQKSITIKKTKGSSIFLYFFLSVIALGTVFILYSDSDQFPYYPTAIVILLLIIAIVFQVLSSIHITTDGAYCYIKEGVSIFSSEQKFKLKKLVKLRPKKYDRSNKGGSGSGFSYNSPFENSGTTSSTYSVLLRFDNNQVLEFGKYISKPKVNEIIAFIQSCKP